MECVLLKGSEEECLVLSHRPSQGEPIHVMAEDGLARLVQLVYVGNGVKALRLESPQQRSMQAVRSGLGDYVENAAAGAAELDAKIAGLHGHLLDRVGDVERLCDAGVYHLVVLGAIQQVVISAKALAVDGKRRFGAF